MSGQLKLFEKRSGLSRQDRPANQAEAETLPALHETEEAANAWGNVQDIFSRINRIPGRNNSDDVIILMQGIVEASRYGPPLLSDVKFSNDIINFICYSPGKFDSQNTAIPDYYARKMESTIGFCNGHGLEPSEKELKVVSDTVAGLILLQGLLENEHVKHQNKKTVISQIENLVSHGSEFLKKYAIRPNLDY